MINPLNNSAACHKCGAIDRNASGSCRPCHKLALKNRRRMSQEERQQILAWAESMRMLGTLTDLCKRLGVKYNTARWLIEHQKLKPAPERHDWSANRIPRERKTVKHVL